MRPQVSEVAPGESRAVVEVIEPEQVPCAIDVGGETHARPSGDVTVSVSEVGRGVVAVVVEDGSVRTRCIERVAARYVTP
jgi:hypothetical protein